MELDMSYFEGINCYKCSPFDQEAIDFGLDEVKARELFGETISEHIIQSFSQVQVINFGEKIQAFKDFIRNNMYFLNSGAFTAVWENDEILNNLVLKVPFSNPIGRVNMVEILEDFKNLNSRNIKSSYTNLKEKLTDDLYQMVYDYHGGPLNILHKVVAHNRFFYVNDFRPEFNVIQTVEIPYVFVIGTTPVGYAQVKAHGKPGERGDIEQIVIMEKYGCIDQNPDNIIIDASGSVKVIDATYPKMNSVITSRRA